MLNTDPSDYCLTCGNTLPSLDTACPRCNGMSASGAAIAPHSSNAAMAGTASMAAADNGTLRERFAQARASVDSVYASVEESAQYDARAQSAGRKSAHTLRHARIGATLLAMLAGCLYLAFGPGSGRGDLERAEPFAHDSIAHLAPDRLIDAPFSRKTASPNLAGTIDAARLAMLHGQLRDARTRLAILPASENKRGDVRQITNELIQRELARDAAIGLARACEKAGDTPCVLRAAGDALGSDILDSKARDMLLRALAQTGTPAGEPAIIAPAAGVSVTANRRADTSRSVAHRRAIERLAFRRETQSFANISDIYSKP